MTSFFVNGKTVEVDVEPSTPLLWVLRDSLGLTGTKFGCGMALCGACTVSIAAGHRGAGENLDGRWRGLPGLTLAEEIG